MIGLTSEELDLLREETVGWFPDTCDIYRVTVVDDPYGGRVETEALSSSGNLCMVDPSPVHAEERASLVGLVAGVMLYTLTFEALIDCRVNDRLVITSQNNLELRAQVVQAPESWDIETTVVASEEGVELSG